MKHRPYRHILILLVISLTGFLLLSVNSSMIPKRSQNQKIFDDFLEEFKLLQKETNAIELQNEDLLFKPSFKLELKQKNESTDQLIEFNLNWLDRSNTSKGIRILELISLANIFSTKDSCSNKNNNTLSIRTSGAVQFEYCFDDLADIHPSLALALVIIKDAGNAIQLTK